MFCFTLTNELDSTFLLVLVFADLVSDLSTKRTSAKNHGHKAKRSKVACGLSENAERWKKMTKELKKQPNNSILP